MKNNIISFSVGLIFAFGLGHSAMTRPTIVKGFLDPFGQWDLTLLGVMIGAIAVHALVYQFIKHKQSPFFDTKFHIPNRRDIDKRLLMGAAIFGLGWGWAGMCPGPAIVSLASGQTQVIVFIVSMLAGMTLFQAWQKNS
jgi:uncharacterized membrane protein YedE/YeeE